MLTGTQWIHIFISTYTWIKLNILADYLSRSSVQHNSTTFNEEPNLTFSNDILPIVPNEVNVNNCENNKNECVNATILVPIIFLMIFLKTSIETIPLAIQIPICYSLGANIVSVLKQVA